ncbi:MAG: ribulose-phosphate 3-epimerase [Chloroflexi bacterium]|nr:ribulose-phosphate 3-epimerase [Chloroflexota bacterium]
MSKQYFIAPSILSADFAKLGQQVKTVEAAGGDWIHLDIMDGHFVPNMSMGRLAVEACRRVTQLPLDVHLMVNSPEKFWDIFAAAGADRITVHIEATHHIHRAIQSIHQLGCKAGVAINPGTPASAVEEILHAVDLILVMTVNPGFGGQKFIPETLPKIARLRHKLDEVNPEAVIQVDGGIAASTLPQVIAAGAQVFVAGNAIFNHPNGIAAGVQALRVCLPA